MNTSVTLTTLIPYNAYWQKVDSGFLVTPIQGHTGSESTLIKDDDLASIHPELPHGMRCMLDWDPMILQSEVNALLSIWRAPVIIETKAGCHRAIIEVDNIHSEYGHLTIVGKMYECAWSTDEVTGKSYRVSRGSTDELVLPETYLDEHYPHWKARFKVGHDLDMQPTDLLVVMLDTGRLVISNAPPSDMSL